MQQRNFVWFMVLSFLILFGWMWMQNQIWPPKPRTEEKAELKVDWKKFGQAASAVNLVANRSLPVGGLLDDIRLGQDLHFTPPEPRRLARWDDLSEEQRKIVVLLPPPFPTTMGVLAQLLPKQGSGQAVEEIPFGNDKSYLQGSFTTRGAGVRKVILNKFPAANWLGEPTKGELELVPDDHEVASFLLYHYPSSVTTDFAKPPAEALSRQIWKLESNKTSDNAIQEVRFSTDIPDEAYKNLRIFKTYRLGPRDYHLSLILEIQDTRTAQDPDRKVVAFRYQLAGAHGLPIEGIWYTSVYRDGVIGMVDSRGGLYRTKEEAMRISVKKGGEAVPTPETGRGDSFLQYAGVITQYFGSVIVVDNEQPTEADGGGDMKKILRWARPTQESVEVRGVLKEIDSKYIYVEEAKVGAGGGDARVRLERKYLLLPRVIKHLQEAKIKKDTQVVVSYYDLDGSRVATWIRPGESPRGFLEDLTVRVNSDIVELKPGQKIAHQFMLYHGPVKTKLLGQFGGDKAVDAGLVDRYAYKLHLRTLTDYPFAGPVGAFSQTIHFTDLLIATTSLMHGLLYYLHLLVGSYGLTIILLTVVVRGLMFPISRKQALVSVKMQELAPEMKKLKAKYPNDRMALAEASRELYRKHNVNPMGSCLPLLMQMPIFLGLYYALQESIHFRLAGFLWIKNLAAPDMLLWWTEKIPWVSDPDNLGGFFYLGPFLNLLPFFAVGLMIVQQKMMTPPAMDEQQEMQQKMMKYMMIFFGIMFYKVASGLCIYFISTSLWGLAERRLLPKKKLALQVTGQAPLPGKSVLPPKGKGPKIKGKKEEKANGSVQKVKDWWAEVLKQAKKK